MVEDSIPPGLAILDAPDIDSVVENRQLATQLLAAADLWLFVTSAARYADAVPVGLPARPLQASAAVAVVLDRVPPRAMTEVPPHLGQLMSERGLLMRRCSRYPRPPSTRRVCPRVRSSRSGAGLRRWRRIRPAARRSCTRPLMVRSLRWR